MRKSPSFDEPGFRHCELAADNFFQQPIRDNLRSDFITSGFDFSRSAHQACKYQKAPMVGNQAGLAELLGYGAQTAAVIDIEGTRVLRNVNRMDSEIAQPRGRAHCPEHGKQQSCA